MPCLTCQRYASGRSLLPTTGVAARNEWSGDLGSAPRATTHRSASVADQLSRSTRLLHLPSPNPDSDLYTYSLSLFIFW